MDDYDDWLVEDPAEMVALLRIVLADSERTTDEKREALTMLANLADDEALDVLRWYRHNADTGLELDAHLAVMEAESLRTVPPIDLWSDDVLDLIIDEAELLFDQLGPNASLETWRRELAAGIRVEGIAAYEGARALLKYGDQLIEIAPVDLVVDGQALVSIWTEERENRRLVGWMEGQTYEPFDFFYSWLRTANLPWGIVLDVTSDALDWDVAGNLDRHQFSTKVEHVLAMPNG